MGVTSSLEGSPTGLSARFIHMRGSFRLQATLEAPQHCVTALFGPSGCGKTTFLRLLCGVDRADKGSVYINGSKWQDDQFFLPAWKRPVGVVFQDSRLFPHLTVKDNLIYGMRRSGHTNEGPYNVIDYEHTISWLGLERLLGRYPSGLSGGEKQRVAMGRAILRNPRLLLLDEPMASLDEKSKVSIMPYLEKMHAELEIPVIYISHSIDEVYRIADRLALMDEGSIYSCGEITEILTSLGLPISRGDRAGAVIEAEVVDHDARFNLSILEFPGGRINVAKKDMDIGAKARLRIIASDVALALSKPKDTSVLNIFEVKVTGFVERNESQMMVKIDAGGVALISRITKKSMATLDLKEGDNCYAMVKSVALMA